MREVSKDRIAEDRYTKMEMALAWLLYTTTRTWGPWDVTSLYIWIKFNISICINFRLYLCQTNIEMYITLHTNVPGSSSALYFISPFPKISNLEKPVPKPIWRSANSRSPEIFADHHPFNRVTTTHNDTPSCQKGNLTNTAQTQNTNVLPPLNQSTKSPKRYRPWRCLPGVPRSLFP